LYRSLNIIRAIKSIGGIWTGHVELTRDMRRIQNIRREAEKKMPLGRPVLG
jgi:hypothetical protein